MTNSKKHQKSLACQRSIRRAVLCDARRQHIRVVHRFGQHQREQDRGGQFGYRSCG